MTAEVHAQILTIAEHPQTETENAGVQAPIEKVPFLPIGPDFPEELQVERFHDPFDELASWDSGFWEKGGSDLSCINEFDYATAPLAPAFDPCAIETLEFGEPSRVLAEFW